MAKQPAKPAKKSAATATKKAPAKKTAKQPAKTKTAAKATTQAKQKPAAKTKPSPTAKAKPTPKAAAPAKAKPAPVATPAAVAPAATAPGAEPVPLPKPVVPALPTALPTAVTREFTKALGKHLGRLKDEPLAAAVAYVLDGSDADVLLNIGKLQEAGKSLALGGVSNDVPYNLRQDIEKERLALLREGVETPPAVWLRLGEVFDAAARASGRKPQSVTGWPDSLTGFLCELVTSYQDVGRSGGPIWPAVRLLPLFDEAKLPPREALRMLLDPSLASSLRRSYYYYGSGPLEGVFADWPPVLADNVSEVREVLSKVGGYHAVQIIPLLTQLKFDFAPVIDVVTKIGVASAKAVRDAASPVLFKHRETVVPHLEQFLADGSAGERNEAAVLLWKLDGEKAVEKLRKHLKNESSEKIRQTIDRLLAAPVEDDAEEITLPPLELELGQVPLPEKAKERIRTVFQKSHELAMRNYDQSMAQWNSPNKPSWMSQPVKPEPIAEDELKALFEFVSGERELLHNRIPYRRSGTGNFADESFAPPDVHLIHVVRLCYALHSFDIPKDDYSFSWYHTSDLDAYRSRCEKPFGLRELDAAVASLPDSKPGLVAFAYLQQNTKYRDFCDWEPEAVWPAFADRLDLLREALSGTLRTGQYDYYLNERKRNAFKALAAFPKLPPGFVPILWDIAMGDAKTDRPLAQAALRTLPDKANRVIVGLSNGKQSVRDTAAEWLGNIGDPVAIPALKDAYRKEKVESSKGVIMVALEKLKADVEEFLDRKKLAKEAEEGMKAAPKRWGEILEKLPAVHWQDTGKQVDPTVVKWWVVQAAAQNSPTCGPILRRYLAMCRPIDTAALAKVALAAYFDTPAPKGVLAIVSAGADADCVKMSEKFIRTWFGQKMAQCKALIEVLAWVKHPMGLQVLLSIANRFRTASLRALAAQHVNAIAEREGWTIDELADRTIPDGGFAKPDAGGRAALVLDYGARQFSATLDDELEPVLTGEGGKVVKALPSPAKADDAEKAKEAKKQFSDAKKQVKDVVKRQTERLYEALCTQRAWRFEDWKRFLGDHPVAGRLCVRLAWTATEPGENGKLLGCFRPLEDGSLTNEKDDAVTFPPDTLVRLAHTASIPAELAAAWKQHFADYAVEPLFTQFGREAYTLAEAKAKDTEIKDFQGYEIGTFQMRGKMTKLGYVRGEAQDGGWFHEYLKPFRSLGVQAEIGFSGNSLPEEDRRAALGTLSFTKIKPEGDTNTHWSRKAMELGKVPPVLLSECYNDLKQLAAEGTGFNPEWEKQSYY